MEDEMPLKRTVEKARKDRREGKSPSTQAGEFVREEIDKIRHGEHGARSTKQAIAIGLSEARRAGVKLPPPKRGQVTERTRKSAEYAYEAGQGKRKPRRRPRVSGAVSRALKREPRNTVSHKALSRQAHTAAARRSAAQHSTAQHSTAQHSTAQHSTAQHSTAQHSTAQHSTAQRSASARQAARTKGAVRRSAAGKKAARTRARRQG
jgi:hypothetical protein